MYASGVKRTEFLFLEHRGTEFYLCDVIALSVILSLSLFLKERKTLYLCASVFKKASVIHHSTSIPKQHLPPQHIRTISNYHNINAILHTGQSQIIIICLLRQYSPS